jgi:hypothetical protein
MNLYLLIYEDVMQPLDFKLNDSNLAREGTNNGIYICRLRNNLFIHTTCFDSNGSSSGAFCYTSVIIEL